MGWGCIARTVEDRADEGSREIGLLRMVQIGWDLWSVRIVGPGLPLKSGHGGQGRKDIPREAGQNSMGEKVLVAVEHGR